MVSIKDLSFGYSRKKLLFENLVLDLQPGNIYGLLGRNGVGKTTLLKIIAGMLFPVNGMCEVFKYLPKNRYPDFLNKIFFLPEELQIPSITILQYEKIYAPFYPRFQHEKFELNLHEFDLAPKLKLSELSLGEKKKFLISFALATDCDLYLLDEPTNGLDIPAKSKFRQLIAAALTENKIFIISTHQVRDLQNLIDPIIILDEGRIIFNKFLYEITERLSFQIKPDIDDDEHVLYSETKLDGVVTVSRNVLGIESKVDLEILFHTILKNKNSLDDIFLKG